MFGLRHRLSFGALGLAIALLAIVGMLSLAGQRSVEAQVGTTNQGEIDSVRYSIRFMNTLQPSKANSQIKRVHIFPEEPIFLLETTENITVWERQNNTLRLLTTITTKDGKEPFEEVLFLEDGRTFIVRTKRAAAVYSLDKLITYRTVDNTNRIRR